MTADPKLAAAARRLAGARRLVRQAQDAFADGDRRAAVELAWAALQEVPLHRLPRFRGEVLQ